MTDNKKTEQGARNTGGADQGHRRERTTATGLEALNSILMPDEKLLCVAEVSMGIFWKCAVMLVFSLVMFFIGGLMAMVIRGELMYPGLQLVPASRSRSRSCAARHPPTLRESGDEHHAEQHPLRSGREGLDHIPGDSFLRSPATGGTFYYSLLNIIKIRHPFGVR